MKIEEIATPWVSLVDTAEIMRSAGFKISAARLKAGIYQGVYPFGEVVDRQAGLTKNDVYTVYTAKLAAWLKEHAWEGKA